MRYWILSDLHLKGQALSGAMPVYDRISSIDVCINAGDTSDGYRPEREFFNPSKVIEIVAEPSSDLDI